LLHGQTLEVISIHYVILAIHLVCVGVLYDRAFYKESKGALTDTVYDFGMAWVIETLIILKRILSLLFKRLIL
jgi:hypothetical protein